MNAFALFVNLSSLILHHFNLFFLAVINEFFYVFIEVVCRCLDRLYPELFKGKFVVSVSPDRDTELTETCTINTFFGPACNRS